MQACFVENFLVYHQREKKNITPVYATLHKATHSMLTRYYRYLKSQAEMFT